MTDRTWRPTPGQVALIEPEGTSDICITGVVMPGDNGAVTIDLGASPDPLSEGAAVVVSFFAPDALYRVRAMAHAHDGGTAVVNLDLIDVERVQRRKAGRAQTSGTAALTGFDDTGTFVTATGEVVDVGSGGCRVRMDTAFRAGASTTLSIRLPDGITVASGVDVHEERELVTGRFEYRLEFTALPPDAQARLSELAG